MDICFLILFGIYLRQKAAEELIFGSQAVCRADPIALRPCLAESRVKLRPLRRTVPFPTQVCLFDLSHIILDFLGVRLEIVPNTVGDFHCANQVLDKNQLSPIILLSW